MSDCISHVCDQCKAKEQYEADIEWALELITDYRIRIGKFVHLDNNDERNRKKMLIYDYIQTFVF